MTKVRIIKNNGDDRYYDKYIGTEGLVIERLTNSVFDMRVLHDDNSVYYWDEDEVTELDTMKILIKYFDETMPRIENIEGKSNWYDLRSAEDISYKQGDYFLVPLGIAVQLPPGYEANIVPRSSTFKNSGLIQTNSFAVINVS